jgi:ABC-2 type transport system ATP-binding protein
MTDEGAPAMTSHDSTIELSQVSRTYGDLVALEEVDLQVGRGEVVALLGPNGAGKTTLFELLLRLVVPTSGTVRVLGEPPGGEVRGRVGAMLQNAGLPDQVTASELVGLVGRSYPQSVDVEALLTEVGLAHRRSPEIATLSGGERQRLLLALALVGRPELLLLDEPTAAMDLEARRHFWAHAREVTVRGATLLFATHDLGEAEEVADRVVLLHRGRVVADASPAQLARLVPGTQVKLVTNAPAAAISAWPGVEHVALTAGAPPAPGVSRLTVSAIAAPCVVVPLVRAGYRLDELTVTEADLETAFARLTGLDVDGVEPADLAPEGAA